MSTWADPPPGPLHEQGVLAQPGVRVLHLRLPAHVPGDLHDAVREQRDGPRRWRRGRHQALDRYYVAAMAAFGVITACYTNIAISVTFARTPGSSSGPGERRSRAGRTSPDASSTRCRGSRILLVVIRRPSARIFYGAAIPTGVDARADRRDRGRRRAAFFCALGLALHDGHPERRRRPRDRERTILPLLFLSGIFIPLEDDAPRWIGRRRRHLPREALRRGAAVPRSSGAPFRGRGPTSLVIAAWGIGRADRSPLRFFSWEPRR